MSSASTGTGSTRTEVLVVEDSVEFQRLIEATLAGDRFDVTIVPTGADALARVQDTVPDLVVLDLGLPDIDGLEVCRQIRGFCTSWVLMLTARDDEVDQLVGLAAGADDYLTKPFSPRVLLARVEALLRRGAIRDVAPANPRATASVLAAGNVRLDASARTVHVADDEIKLTRKEFDVLAALLAEQNAVVSRRALVARVWGDDWYGDDHVIDVHMTNLRKKLTSADATMEIGTVRGIGFRLTAPD